MGQVKTYKSQNTQGKKIYEKKACLAQVDKVHFIIVANFDKILV